MMFPGLEDIIREGDLLVMNDTKVIRGRLRARKETGGAVEIFLLAPMGDRAAGRETWEALARPSKRLREGMCFRVGGDLEATLLDRLGEGRWSVRLSAAGSIQEAVDRAGEIPLPPYIRRKAGDPLLSMDTERYQTVYARHRGSVAAPTAGLHFDKELIARIRRAGISTSKVTLSIGYGTFRTIRADEVEEHDLHSEEYRLGKVTAGAVAKARASGGRIVAVGTTSVRVLETCAGRDGSVVPSEGTTKLFITPGYRFRAVDAMLTNFHLPRSSLLALVMAFGGVELIREAYRQAVEQRYRFFSYGDAMLIF
ncbi:MAG: S-adenosylmethionine:tRNA ribosyltransferase-isomerase [Actinobacteria bacterium]|nr:S-adenosylmethionine:tRNA ribosyltransferase-isomerase [Actinomycetota bacterium]